MAKSVKVNRHGYSDVIHGVGIITSANSAKRKNYYEVSKNSKRESYSDAVSIYSDYNRISRDIRKAILVHGR